MAGKGKRMLPHTLTTLKPMVPIAGKPIVKRILEEIRNVYNGHIANIGFIVKDLSPTVQSQLEEMGRDLNAQVHFFEQKEALGTAHAIGCASSLLKGPILIAFSDTLFRNPLPIDASKENIIWVNKVKEPAAFGVVKVGPDNLITDFIEKPTQFISDLAIIGMYYFREGTILKKAIQEIIDQNISNGGEYQLTSVLEYMQQQGSHFFSQQVEEWLDCGNKEATLYTNQRFLQFLQGNENTIAATAQIHNSKVVPPVFIGDHVMIEHSVIGPYVAIGNNTHITACCIQNSIIQAHSKISQANLEKSMIGNYVTIQGHTKEMNVGDYNTIGL
jgi:glucose-1-phosphate thymidylyltransferase